MIYSMTGYAAKNREICGGQLGVELKSVNSRFLDLHFKLPEELRFPEMSLRESITAKVRRGKLECRLNFIPANGQGRQVLNQEALTGLCGLESRVRALVPEAAPLSVNEILRWPGILSDLAATAHNGGDNSLPLSAILELLEETLHEFNLSRAREGEKLAAVILGDAQKMRAVLAEISPHIPAVQEAFAEKLRQRLKDALAAIGENYETCNGCIMQEVAVFSARMDVAEELARLAVHLDELEHVFKTGGTVGKRLDFLMQELNREANTLASKSAATAMTQSAMALKLLIEQMREQVQNLE